MYDVIIFTDNTDPMQVAIPLGGFKIASVLRKNGYKTLVVNHFSKFSVEELKQLLNLVISDKTKLLGFSNTFLKTTAYGPLPASVIFPHGKDVENDIITFVKSKNASIKIVVGGARSVTSCNNKNIDYIFMGYSEVSILRLMQHLINGHELSSSYKNIHGIVVIDDRTAPSYHFTSDSMVWEQEDIVNHKVLPIEIGRGCIFKCKFCSYPLNGKKSLDYIKESDIIYDELLTNYEKFGVEHYFIVDDTFNDSIEKLEQLSLVINRLPFNPKFWCYARLDLICTRPQTLDLLYNIGVRAFYFGIETLNETTGRLIGKGYNREKQIEMISTIRHKYPGISMHGSFILGLPNEPKESFMNTVDQLLDGSIPLHSWMMKPLMLHGDTSLSFLSDLDINHTKYGYKILGSHDGHLYWVNEHIDLGAAAYICKNFIAESRKKKYFNVPGHDAFEFVNYGYNFGDTMSTTFAEFRFDIVKDTVVTNFISEYKSQLFNILHYSSGAY